MKTKKVPMRRCIGCMESKPKKELIRVVAAKPEEEGGVAEVILDPTGKAPGRGAYLCPKAECFEKAVKKRAIARSLNAEVTRENLDRLSEELKQYEQQ
ncbi:MAG: YlxR family protein [Firmicutes bacterium]|nr:YlxR family protein [Bacillota bacterium]